MQTETKQMLRRLFQKTAPMKADLTAWKRFVDTELPSMDVETLLEFYQEHVYIAPDSEEGYGNELPTPDELRQAVKESHQNTAPSQTKPVSVVHQKPLETLDQEELAKAVRDHLLEEEERVDSEGLPEPFFQPAQLAWTMSKTDVPHHAEVVRGFTLAFGSLIEWFATLATTGITADDWNYLIRVTLRLCHMIYSREESVTILSFRKLAASLAILIQRRQQLESFPFQHPNLLVLVAEAAGPECQKGLNLLLKPPTPPANDEDIVPTPMLLMFGT